MKNRAMGTSVLLALFISAGLATAQTTNTPTYETAVTTGIVGWAVAAQTAQLTVLNVAGGVLTGSLGSSATPAACPVALEFHDAQNNVLKSLQVSNLAPGAAVSLTLKLADLPAAPTTLRVEIRGVVRSNPISSGPVPASSLPMIPFSNCAVMPTLELFDSSTGITQMFSSDTRPFGIPVVVPLAITN